MSTFTRLFEFFRCHLKSGRATWIQLSGLAFGALSLVVFQNCAPGQFHFQEVDLPEKKVLSCDGEQCPSGLLNTACVFNGVEMAHGARLQAFEQALGTVDVPCRSEERVCESGQLTGSFTFAKCVTEEDRIRASCSFNGLEISSGQSAIAFRESSVVSPDVCLSEERQCQNGSLTGTFAYANCSVGAPRACLFNGRSIESGGTVTGYQASAVPFGQSCTMESRVCNDGILSGQFTYPACQVGGPQSCMFDGMVVPHGEVTSAFRDSAVPYGASCQLESRVCNNGNLSGSYSFRSCSVGAPSACRFNGATVAHLGKVIGFQNSSVPYGQSCHSEERVCTNGSLSGSYNHASCSLGLPRSCLFNGRSIPHGSSAEAYRDSSVAFGQSCVRETRTCLDGSLSGSYSFASCNIGTPNACLFNGETIAHGASARAFQNSSVPFGQSCQSENRVCSNGVLSGSYVFGSCNQGAPRSCLFNGHTVAHGSGVRAFAESRVMHGQSCISEERVCSNGALSGNYSYASCNVAVPNSCLFNGRTVAHGSSVDAFLTSTVPVGNSCSQQRRTCNNGTLSGSYSFSSCAPAVPASCQFNGQTIGHGSMVVAYSSTMVSFGQTCASQLRNCNNGTLSGSYTHATCQVASPNPCTFNGSSVPHGSSVTAWSQSTVPFGGSCTSQTRTCNNGSLSGTNQFNSCTVSSARSCTLTLYSRFVTSGSATVTLAHGQSLLLYSGNRNSDGQCESMTRTCNDGSVSGDSSYNNPDCSGGGDSGYNGGGAAT